MLCRQCRGSDAPGQSWGPGSFWRRGKESGGANAWSPAAARGALPPGSSDTHVLFHLWAPAALAAPPAPPLFLALLHHLVCLLSTPHPSSARAAPGPGTQLALHGWRRRQSLCRHEETEAQRGGPRSTENGTEAWPGKGISCSLGAAGSWGSWWGRHRVCGPGVWQRQLGLLGPSPHPAAGGGREAGREAAAGGWLWASAEPPLGGAAWSSRSLRLSFFLCISVCALSMSVSLPLCVSLSVCLSLSLPPHLCLQSCTWPPLPVGWGTVLEHPRYPHLAVGSGQDLPASAPIWPESPTRWEAWETPLGRGDPEQPPPASPPHS